jgi:hypothetical protein
VPIDGILNRLVTLVAAERVMGTLSTSNSHAVQLRIKDFLATGTDDPPSQLRGDGCREVPPSARYESLRRSNPFRSLLVVRYRALAAEHDEQNHR